jgi:hypothetical protein
MGGYQKGGCSTFYAEQIQRTTQEPGSPVRTMSIYAEREATLTEDLSAIESRYLRAIVVEFNSGWPEDYWIARLTKGQAADLRNALDRALRATDGDDLR